jgi:hypothetical protein
MSLPLIHAGTDKVFLGCNTPFGRLMSMTQEISFVTLEIKSLDELEFGTSEVT